MPEFWRTGFGNGMGERGRILLILNSSSGSADNTVARASRLIEESGYSVELQQPDEPARISDIIRETGPSVDRIVLGGGDGTFSHSAPALIDADRPVGLLPLGTANDLARTLGVPRDLDAAVRIATGQRSRRIDLGTINGRPFFNVASIGFSARVAQHHAGERKKRLKMFSYPLSWLDAQRNLKPFTVTLLQGRRKRRFRSTMVAVGNGVHFGGGLMIADDAAIDDGWLDVLYVRPLSALGMAKLLPFLKFGAIKRRQDVRTLRASELTLEAEPDQDFNVDGELVESTPATFGVLRKALEVFVPPPTYEKSAEPEATMELMRDDQVVAMNDVIVALRREAGHLRTAAETARAGGTGDAEVTSRLESAALDYEDKAGRLADIVRDLDDIPDSPSDEAQLVGAAAVKLKAVFSADTVAAMEQEIPEARTRLSDVASEALSQIRDDAAREIVGSLTD